MAIKIKVKGGPGEGTYFKPTTSLDTTADVRDLVSFIAAKGANMNDPDVRASYGRLAALKGAPVAQKLFTQLSLHGQRDEVKGMTDAQKIQSFYDIGSSDPTVGPIIQQARAFGKGPLAGYFDSTLLGNQQLQGEKLKSAVSMSPDVQKMKLKIAAMQK